MRRATLDRNILVSAFQFGGKPQALIQMALDGEIEIAISQPIIDDTILLRLGRFSGISILRVQEFLAS